MNKNATILIGNDYANIDPNYLKSENTKLPKPYDADSIKYTIKILQANNYDIKLITWEEYLRNKGLVQKLIIVAQWLLIYTKWDMSTLINFRKRVNVSIENGCDFILMHGFYPEYPFMKILDIDLYEDKETGKTFFQNKRLFKVSDNNSILMKGVRDFIFRNEFKFKSDEFNYIMRNKSSFETLVEKIPQKGSEDRFISFGYQKLNFNNYIFIVDIHNIGKIQTHADYFSLLLNNILNYISNKNS